MSKRKRKKGMAMNLETFQAANGGPSQHYGDILPSAPLGEEGRMRRGRGRGGWRGGGGGRRDDFNRGGGNRGYGNPSRGEASTSWRSSGGDRMRDPGFNRGNQDRGGGFNRDNMDGGFRDRDRDDERGNGPELNRNAFGTKTQAAFAGRRDQDGGGGGYGRTNKESRSNFDRSNFGTASSGSSNRIGGGGRREIFREKERQPVDDSREWRRREPLRTLGNTRRNFEDRPSQDLDRRDRDRDRDDLRSWRREEPPSWENDRRMGGGGGGFARGTESQDWRRDRRESPEPQPLQPVAITVASKQHTWNRRPTYTSSRFVGRERRDKPSRRFGPSSNAFSADAAPKGKFAGTSSGFGADILAQTSPTLVASAEFDTAGTSYGRSRLSFSPTITLDPPMTMSSRFAAPGRVRQPVRQQSMRQPPARQQPVPEYPSLPKNKMVGRTTTQNAVERRLAKELLEQKKREKMEEKQRKKEERERKLKIKAERIQAVKEHLDEDHPEFLGPLNIDVLRTGTMKLEFEGRQRERKRQMKNLAMLLVNSILSPNHDCEFRRVLRFIRTRDIDSEDRFSLLILTLRELEVKAGEFKALEVIGELLQRVLEALECDLENPRDSLEDLNLRYLAPRVDVESALNEAMDKGLGVAELIKILHRGEEDGEGSVDPVLAEKLLLHILERLFSSTVQEVGGFFDTEMCAALNDLQNYVNPVRMISMMVVLWYENSQKLDVKEVLLAVVEREVISKQDVLDFQDDVPSAGCIKSKQTSLLYLTGWFTELDAELNPPEYSDDEDEESDSEEDEDEEEESDEE